MADQPLASDNDGPVAHQGDEEEESNSREEISDGVGLHRAISMEAAEEEDIFFHAAEDTATPTRKQSVPEDISGSADVVNPLAATSSVLSRNKIRQLSSDKNNGNDILSRWKMDALDAALGDRSSRSCMGPGFFTISIPTDFNDDALSEIGSDLQTHVSQFHPNNNNSNNNNDETIAGNNSNHETLRGDRSRMSGTVGGSVLTRRSYYSHYRLRQQPVSSPAQYLASSDSKYESYAVCVDREQDDKACEIPLCSMKRPHMRGFHFAWMSMYVGFILWFAITPLMGEIQDTLGLTKQEVWTSSVYGTIGTIVTRLVMGPLCDKYGSRLCMATIIFVAAIPSIALGVVNSSMVLNILRLCIGVAGAAFVAGESWTSSLFVKEIAGTALSIVSGWGNLGGAIAQVIMGAILFPILKLAYGGDSNPSSAERAWRTAFIFPAILGLVASFMLVKYSDDSPKGNYLKRERQRLRVPVSAVTSMRGACRQVNTWILFVQYSCCFGVEFAMNNAAVLYFRDQFDLTTEQSAAVASIFGWMNLFARGLGGFASDIGNAKYRMRGRILFMFIILLLEGASIVLFAVTSSFQGAVIVMVVFSLFVQAAEGSVYAIVPYVNPRFTGSVSGVVGAGGTVGGAVFSILFREFDYQKAFFLMGVIVAGSSLLSFTLNFKGFDTLCCRKSQQTRQSDTASEETLEIAAIPEEEDEITLRSLTSSQAPRTQVLLSPDTCL